MVLQRSNLLRLKVVQNAVGRTCSSSQSQRAKRNTETWLLDPGSNPRVPQTSCFDGRVGKNQFMAQSPSSLRAQTYGPKQPLSSSTSHLGRLLRPRHIPNSIARRHFCMLTHLIQVLDTLAESRLRIAFIFRQEPVYRLLHPDKRL